MLLRKILFPVAVLNYLFQLIRSFLYANNFFKVHQTKINTICIGNLSLGGTGKTPLVKFLIGGLSKKINISHYTINLQFKPILKIIINNKNKNKT